MSRLAVCLTLLAAACSSSPAAVDAGDAQDLFVSPFCTCPLGQGCLRANVSRAADQSMQPWVAFAAMGSDGVGTLIVSVLTGTTVVQRSAITGADLKPAANVYPVDFGCLDANTYTLHAFLDDNLNAAPDDNSSSDFHDSCPVDRAPTKTVADAQIGTVAIELANSCD